MNTVSSTGNRKAIIFVVKLLTLYVVFSQGNVFMNGLFTEGGFYNQFLAKHFNYIQVLKTGLLTPATWLINYYGFYAIHNLNDVMVVNGPYLQINYDCLGLGIMSFLTAFVIAFPAKLKPKFKLLAIGLTLIYVLNICRIAGLGILLSHFKSQQRNFIYHHEIFNLVIYACIFLVIYFWIKKTSLSQLSIKTKLEDGNAT